MYTILTSRYFTGTDGRASQILVTLQTELATKSSIVIPSFMLYVEAEVWLKFNKQRIIDDCRIHGPFFIVLTY